MGKIIQLNRSFIPSLDCNLRKALEVLEGTKDIEQVGAYKTGFSLALRYGLERAVTEIKNITGKPVIHDNQKAGTDIPDTAAEYARIMQECGVDAAIIFPLSGPATLEAYVKELQNVGVEPIVGGEMTHPKFLEEDGGYFPRKSAERIYRDVAKLGVTNFVVPGTKPERIKFYRELIQAEGIEPTFYIPGIGEQGGTIEEIAKVAGERWHAIIGRGIYNAENIRKATLEFVDQLNSI